MTLALIGLYGLVSYGVSQRTREIGVRMAIGARPKDIVVDVLANGVRVVLLGLAAGVGLAVLGMRGISGLLFEIPAVEPMSSVAVSLLLLTAAGFACYIPARRASRIDPMEALRYE